MLKRLAMAISVAIALSMLAGCATNGYERAESHSGGTHHH